MNANLATVYNMIGILKSILIHKSVDRHQAEWANINNSSSGGNKKIAYLGGGYKMLVWVPGRFSGNTMILTKINREGSGNRLFDNTMIFS